MYLPKIPFYFLNCLFIYHYFPEVPFCFLDVSFPFSEIHYCFSAFGFSFPEVASFYLLCMSFSKNAFFQLIGLYPERYNVCLALVLFPLGALCWSTYDAFLKTLKSPHWVWFFCLFYSDFSINFNLENAVTEYLKWLKMGENFNQDIFCIQAFVLLRHCFDQDISSMQIWFSISTARKAKRVCIQ